MHARVYSRIHHNVANHDHLIIISLPDTSLHSRSSIEGSSAYATHSTRTRFAVSCHESDQQSGNQDDRAEISKLASVAPASRTTTVTGAVPVSPPVSCTVPSKGAAGDAAASEREARTAPLPAASTSTRALAPSTRTACAHTLAANARHIILHSVVLLYSE